MYPEQLNSYTTPLYLFDTAVLHQRIHTLKAALPQDIQLCYAIKANPFLVTVLDPFISRYEVCSPGELAICQKQGINPAKIVLSGVYKTPQLLAKLISSKVPIGWYTVESKQQLSLLATLASQYQTRLRLLLRLSSGNQFGLDESDLKAIIQEYSHHPNLDIVGIQYFSGTQKTSLKRLKRELDMLDQFLFDLQDQSHWTCQELEFGPGFPVSYFTQDDFDEPLFFDAFSQLMKQRTSRCPVILELGRSIAASCGSYLTRIVDLKTNHKQNYAIVDGGIHQLVYYGQSMAMKHPQIMHYPQREGEPAMNWHICGSLCTANDILVKNIPLIQPQIGDLLVFKNAGAYCMTEGMALFLSRDLPTVLLINQDQSITCLRQGQDTYPFNMPMKERS